MKNFSLTLVAFCSMVLFTFGCLNEDDFTPETAQLNLPAEVMNYADIQLPAGLQQEFDFNAPQVFNNSNLIDPFFFENPNPQVTDHGATLGRVLFYDKALSLNNSVSCASCHLQEKAFSDPVAGSKGFEGKITPRNSMAINNVALNRNLFWDSRANSALDLTLQPVQNHIEMGMEDLKILETKLAKTDYYAPLFKNAFGNTNVSSDKISNALAQFLCSIVSADSKFDRMNDDNLSEFNSLEMLGMQLFFSERTQCSGCHNGANFAAADFPGGEYGSPSIQGTANTGLDLVASDEGFRNGQFRIPSLRNIALTAPYMHDGRFATLDQVIDFYDHGVQAHQHLDDKLVGDDGEPLRLNLSSLEKEALKAFLNALTDDSMPKDPRFSDPFLR